jgi:hypothetical protein
MHGAPAGGDRNEASLSGLGMMDTVDATVVRDGRIGEKHLPISLLISYSATSPVMSKPSLMT